MNCEFCFLSPCTAYLVTYVWKIHFCQILPSSVTNCSQCIKTDPFKSCGVCLLCLRFLCVLKVDNIFVSNVQFAKGHVTVSCCFRWLNYVFSSQMSLNSQTEQLNVENSLAFFSEWNLARWVFNAPLVLNVCKCSEVFWSRASVSVDLAVGELTGFLSENLQWRQSITLATPWWRNKSTIDHKK